DLRMIGMLLGLVRRPRRVGGRVRRVGGRVPYLGVRATGCVLVGGLVFGGDRFGQSATAQQRRDIGSGAEEAFDRRHRVDRESGGEDGFAEGVSGLAVEPAVVFEPFADPGGDDLGVEVGVVAGGIPGGEDVTEVGGAVPGL